MPALLFILFICVPLVELFLLIYVGKFIGAPATIGIIFLTGTVGFALFRYEFRIIKNQWAQKIQAGSLPYEESLEGLMLLLGAAFLMTPGILTDIIGFLLVLPGSRQALRAILTKIGKAKLQGYVVNGNYVNIISPFGNFQSTPPPQSNHNNDEEEAEFKMKE